MKVKLLFFILCLFAFYSCSNKFIVNRDYVFKEGSKRKLTLTFQNDSVCVVKNFYKTDENETKEFVYKCRYGILSNDYLLLTNDGKLVDTAGIGYFYFPKKDTGSSSLKWEKDILSTSPNYSNSNDKYLKVPYVGKDTLIRYRKNILWIKKDRDKNVVGYFKFKRK